MKNWANFNKYKWWDLDKSTNVNEFEYEGVEEEQKNMWRQK